MTRRGFALAVLAAIGFVSPHSFAAPVAKPNIVFILADDLGIGDVHAFNPQKGKIATPNIDRLAGEGMMFTDAHASASVCTPSRYSILTGRYSWRSRLQSGAMGGMAEPIIIKDRLTVASFLKAQGYDTACLGKWHLGLDMGPEKFKSKIADGPLQHGFDHFFGIAASLDMAPFAWIEDDHFTEPVTATKKWLRAGPAQPSFEAIDVQPTLTTKAVEYISAHGKTRASPFFLYLAFAAPHTPILPTAEWKGKSGLGDYADFVMQVDASVGTVLKAIDDAGHHDDTIVYFASDNGFAPAAGPKKLEAQGHFPSIDYRGYKADVWEGGHRIPLIVRWPGVVAPGSQSNQLVGLIDFFATTADMLHRPLPETAAEDSVDLMPILTGNNVPVRESEISHSNYGYFAIRRGTWKLELCHGSGGWAMPREGTVAAKELPPVQLYDLATDPGEQHNVQAEYPQIVKELRTMLEDAIKNGRTTPGKPQKNEAEIIVDKKPTPEAAAG